MSPKVTVIDYGIGNIFSIRSALEHCGAEMILTDSSRKAASADRLLLPGVGAFSDGMDGLRRGGFVEAVLNFAERERPFLGICLGMQMMLDVSEEFGEHEGLGLIPGRVVRIPSRGIDGKEHKIPHIGWNRLERPSTSRPWNETILKDVLPGNRAYFVHSYTAVPDREEHRLADTFYNGIRLSAAVARESLFGCQFHPERSGERGLLMLRNFLEL